MAVDPSFPFYASDWLGSNNRAAMSMEQQAAYLLLLCRQWSDPTCSLPDDDTALANLSELHEEWLKGGSVLVRKCFPKNPHLNGRISNKKLLKIRADLDAWRAKSSEGGKKSGETRRRKAKQKKDLTPRTKREPNANQTRTKGATKGQPNANTPLPLPLPSLSTASAVLHPALKIEIPMVLNTPAFGVAWKDWTTYRGKKKPKLLPESWQKQINNMAKYGETASIAAIEHSIANGYQGVFPEKFMEEKRGKHETRRTDSRKPGRATF